MAPATRVPGKTKHAVFAERITEWRRIC